MNSSPAAGGLRGRLPRIYPNPVALEPTFEEAWPPAEAPRRTLPAPWDRTRRATRYLKLWPSPAEDTPFEQWPAWFKGLTRVTEPVSFEVLGCGGAIQVLFAAHVRDVPLLADAVTVQQDHAWLEPLASDPLHAYCTAAKQGHARVELHLLDCYARALPFVPLFAAKPPTADPLEALYSVLADLAAGECGVWQVLFVPARRAWRAYVRDRLVRDRTLSEHTVTRVGKGLAEHEGLPLFAAAVRLAVFAPRERVAALLPRLRAAAALPFRDGGFLHLTRDDYAELGLPHRDHLYMLLNRVSFRTGMLLSSRDLASLAHCPPPQALRRWPAIARSPKSYPVPAHLTQAGQRIGHNVHRGVRRAVHISERLQNRHAILTGKSGCGKSTLIQNMVAEHLAHGDGFGVVDPHGALIRELILPLIPKERLDDVIYFNPGDFGHPIAFNILAHSGSKTEKEHIRVDLLDFFEELLETKLGVTVAHLLNFSLAVLLTQPDATLADLERLLTDAAFRERLLSGIADEGILRFWATEFPTLAKKGSVLTITNKLSPLLLPESAVRPMLVQRQNAVNFLPIMNEKKIFLANLAIGTVGQRNSELLGRLLVSKLQIAGMMREGLSAFPDWYLYLDEFQHMATPTMKGILTGARKYKLHLTLATQYIANIPEHLVGPVFNASTMVFFTCDLPKDQHFIDKVLAGRFAPGEIGQLKRGEAVAKIDGYAFNLKTAPPATPAGDDLSREVIARSRARYASAAKTDAQAATTARPADEAVAPTQHHPVATAHPAAEKGTVRPPRSERRSLERTPSASSREKATSAPASAAASNRAHQRAPTPERPLGKGGPEHRYLQHLIRRLAEERGFAVTLERPVLDGAGNIDVALERDAIKIACEISVTSTPEYEAGNIAKCVSAGYDPVLTVCAHKRTLQKLEVRLSRLLAEDTLAKVRFCLPEQVIEYLDELPPPAEPATTVGGYKVRVQYSRLDPKEKAARKQAIANVLVSATKRLKAES